jgi:glycerol-3-phosphate dehydrogenase (NAD(P)+)
MEIKAKITIIGNGSFATALAKVLSHNNHYITWWMRSEEACLFMQEHNHNPHYLNQVSFTEKNISYTNDMNEALAASDIILLAVPSAFLGDVLVKMNADIAKDKIFVSAIKGIVPHENILINEYLERLFAIPEERYCCITGPCHAEEIASEKLSYLTFSSHEESTAVEIATHFATPYLRTVVSTDVYGVQFAAILKNIYALGAGIAHGLDYGDNFLSVYNTNCFAEMKSFMKTIAEHNQQLNTPHHYITSAYLGDLLVTSYSLHSRNRRFGNMIGKGYSVNAAKLELNMVAEGYYAAKCIKEISDTIQAHTPITTILFDVLWHNKNVKKAFGEIENLLQ